MIRGDLIGLIAISDDGVRLRQFGFSFDENRALRAGGIPASHFQSDLKARLQANNEDAELHG